MDFAHIFHRDDTPGAADPRNFSIVLGGPLYQMLRRARITGDALELARRRMLIIAMAAWLPLLFLSLVGGLFWSGVAVPFVKDVQVHVRYLVVLPLLVAAEILVHMRLRPVAQEFLTRGLVPEASMDRFRECVRSAFRLRNSVAAELAMIAFIYGVGVPFVWRHYSALDVSTWYAMIGADGVHLTGAGIWYAWVAVPLFQFLLLRWYFRILIWTRFLWQVSRIPLNVTAMHADRSAGLGFLSGTVYAFVPLLMAHGALLAGTIANRVFHGGGTLMDSRIEIALVVAFLLLLVIAPLVAFAPQINSAKRKASREYGRLVQRYVTEFEGRWLPGGLPPKDSPLGAADMQSLTDLNESLATVKGTSVVPVSRDAIVKLALAVLVPVAPLLLTVIPAEELAKRLLKLLI